MELSGEEGLMGAGIFSIVIERSAASDGRYLTPRRQSTAIERTAHAAEAARTVIERPSAGGNRNMMPGVFSRRNSV